MKKEGMHREEGKDQEMSCSDGTVRSSKKEEEGEAEGEVQNKDGFQEGSVKFMSSRFR